MERHAPSSRLQAPSVRAPTTGTAAAGAPASKRGSGGGSAVPGGFRRPSAASSTASPVPRRVSQESTPLTPPPLALHELQHTTPAPPPPPAATYLKRGAGRTIATLGNPAAAAVMTPPLSTRRKSGSPRASMSTPTNQNGTARWNSANANVKPNAAPLRSRHGSRDAAELLVPGNKMAMPKSYEGTDPQYQQPRQQKPQQLHDQQHHHDQEEQLQQQQTPLSPESYLRQRKRSADMMDPANDLAVVSSVKQASMEPEEVDEPPLTSINRGEFAQAQGLAVAPMTPPHRTSTSSLQKGEVLPESPRKRQKRIARSPKTPLGSSNYETEEGRLSATQRVRLSLSGYMTASSLNAAKSGLPPAPMLLSNGEDETASTDDATATATLTPQRSSSTSVLNRSSSSSLARSKFSASRSMSGSALQIASVLMPTKNSVDCLMGYIRELQKSEATLRVQLENVKKKQRQDEHARSNSALGSSIHSIESSERRQLEEQEQLIESLKAEVAELHYAMMTNQSPQSAGSLHVGDLGPPQFLFPESPGFYGSSDAHPASSYVTPPPSRPRGLPYQRTRQESSTPNGVTYEGASDPSTIDAGVAPPPPTEWTEQYYHQPEGYYQYPEASSDQNNAVYNEQDYYQYPPDPNMVQETAHTSEWAEQNAPHDAPHADEWAEQNTSYDDQGNYYNNHASGVVESYPAMVPSPTAAPMSPVARLDPSRSPLEPKIMPPQTDVPPMFRVAPRLSDIISPISRSVIAAPVTTDYNVLTPVTPQALANTRQPRNGGDTGHQQTAADQAFVMAPAPLGPPRFTMTGFDSNSVEQEAMPQKNGATADGHAHSVPDLSPRQEEQFVPAEQVFKPFHTPKPPIHKASTTTPKRAASLSLPTEAMKGLLVEFFTAVDKSRVRMAEGYSKRYHGQEAKLFAELSKKYGDNKVAELKRKFEMALNGDAPNEQLLSAETASTTSAITPVPPVASFQATPTLEDTATVTDLASPWAPPPSTLAVESGQDHANYVASESHLDPVPPSAGHMLPPPPIIKSSLPPPVPSQKVSPRGPRRGPPMPFAFDDSPMTSDMLPPPQVSVATPPPTMTPPPSPRSVAAALPPPRLAPSPPRVPPPPASERSPARNAAVLRQRVAAQRPSPLTMGSSPSPPRPNPPPVTLESLLVEFYRKHQPDRLKNVPEVVRQYSGKERELISLLKQKYGALSIKRLEQNLELLETQRGAAGVVNSPAEPSNEKKPKARGCLGRLVFFLVKLILIRVIITLMLLGGFVTLDHTQCAQEEHGVDDCTPLQLEVKAFETSRLMEYVQRVESRACFCDEWRQREDGFLHEPSVAHAADLVKLVAFGRTIAEPAWLQFVDAYFPNLPYSEFYHSYAKPVLVTGKSVVVMGAGHAKTAYTVVAANMPDMTEQLALLVEMYHEAGSSTRAEDVAAMPSSVDMLTNAAKASKALAESTTEIKDKVDTDAAAEAMIPQETESVVSYPTAAPVEIVVEQSGLDLSYTETAAAAAEVEGQEVAASRADEAVVIEEIVVEEESTRTDVQDAPEEIIEVDDTETVDDALPTDATPVDTVDDVTSAETEPVEIVHENDDGAKTHAGAEVPEELHGDEEPIAATDSVTETEQPETTIVMEETVQVSDTAPTEIEPAESLHKNDYEVAAHDGSESSEELHVAEESIATIDSATQVDEAEQHDTTVRVNEAVHASDAESMKDSIATEIEVVQQNDNEGPAHDTNEVLLPEESVVVDEQNGAIDVVIQDTQAPSSEDVRAEPVPVVEDASVDSGASMRVQTELQPVEAGDEPITESVAVNVESESKSESAFTLETEDVPLVEAMVETVVEVVEESVAEVDAIAVTQEVSDVLSAVELEATVTVPATASEKHEDPEEHADEDVSFLDDTDGLDLLDLLDLADVAAAELHSNN